MRIACLQFAPQVGDVNNNLNRADSVLNRANPQDLDLLVLPELAFSGYNFRSLQHITPYLEPTAAGITSLWARTTALKYNCVVTAGYPEKVDVAPKWPAGPEYYNSTITVNSDGETVANYRKSFLYYTDETWALEGPNGFYSGPIDGLGDVAMGICMDLNPYKFEAPWSAWEFAHHVLHVQANLVVLSMAWLTREDARAFSRVPREPDMDTLSYWLARLEPLIRAETEGEIIVVFANRCGSEDEATYAGTSAVLGINAGEVKVYGILGRGEKELLVVDTNKRPSAKLVSERNSAVSETNPTPIAGAATSGTRDKSEKKDPEVRPKAIKPVAPQLDADELMSALNEAVFEEEDFYQDYEDPFGFTPISPTDAKDSQEYAGGRPDIFGKSDVRDRRRNGRRDSSVLSPGLKRPPSPKSRNASRSRTRQFIETRHSGETRQYGEIPVMLADNLAANLGKSPVVGQFQPWSQPQSASLILDDDSSFTQNELGPRELHISRRPKSTAW